MSKSTLYVGIEAYFVPAPLVNSLSGDLHLTILFSKPENQSEHTDRVPMKSVNFASKVLSIEYWPRPNVTVATYAVDEALISYREELADAGFAGDLELVPHVTLCKGDLTEKYEPLTGCRTMFVNPYFKLK